MFLGDSLLLELRRLFLGDAQPLEARSGRRGPGRFALRLLGPLAFEDALALRSKRSRVDLGREARLLLRLELRHFRLGDAQLLCRFRLGGAQPLEARDGRRGPGRFALSLLGPLAFEDALAFRSERSRVDLSRERRLLLRLELCHFRLGDAQLLCRFRLGGAQPLEARDGRRGPGRFALSLLGPLAFEDALAFRSERSRVDLSRERRLLLRRDRLFLGDALLLDLLGLEPRRFRLGDAQLLEVRDRFRLSDAQLLEARDRRRGPGGFALRLLSPLAVQDALALRSERSRVVPDREGRLLFECGP